MTQTLRWPPRDSQGRRVFHGVCPVCSAERWVTGWSELHPQLCDCRRPRPHMAPCLECVRMPGIHQPSRELS